MQVTENVLYLAFTIFGVFVVVDFLLFSVDLIWWLICIYIIQTFISAHLAVYLIWWRDSSTKGVKKNTSPNVIRLQYFITGPILSVKG